MQGRQGNSISVAEVEAALPLTTLQGTIQHFAEVGSTNDLALEAAQRGQRAGVWVADAQTAGRGRGGHGWHSAPGDGLYVSVLLSPRLPALSSSSLGLSLTAGLAAWTAIRDAAGLTADLRWPNDLMTRPLAATPERSRKLGGILVEAATGQPPRAGTPALLRYAVVGIGINVGHRAFPPALEDEASSLYLEGWQTPDRQALLIALLQRLDEFVRAEEARFAGDPDAPNLLPALEGASTWLRGKRVRVPEDGGYTGRTAGLDASGFLLVDSDDGTRRTVRSGGVREL